MDKLKFGLISIITLAVVGLGAYWAIITMQSGSEYVNNQKIRKLETENEDLKKQISLLEKTEAPAPKPVEEPVAVAPKAEKPAEPVKKPTTTTKTYKNQTLINELQKLADKGVVIESKSASPAVGSVQKFLNVYNKTSNKVDNDYGATSKTKVIAFQKAQGLTADGGVGKTTFLKMVAWLKKQG